MNLTENMTVSERFVQQPLWLSLPLYGFVAPIVILLGSTLNAFVVMVLVRSKMRSPSHTLLVGMAVFDVLTGVCALPAFVYTYTLGTYHDYVPYVACLPLLISYDWLPTIFHTASIWTTTLLAIQRYLNISQRKVYTVRQMLYALLIILALATVVLSPRFAEFDLTPVEVESQLAEEPPRVLVSCAEKPAPWMTEFGDMYYTCMYWFRAICIHLLPCCLLGLLNGLIIHRMRQAERRKRRLLPELRSSRDESNAFNAQLSASSSSRQSENRSTWMLVVVVFMFLLVEFPLAIFFTLVVICNNHLTSVTVWSDDVKQIVGLIVNFLIILSCPFNFFIYCGMSRQFRDEFWVIMGRHVALSAARCRRTTLNTSVLSQPPVDSVESDEHEKLPLDQTTIPLVISNGDAL